VERYWSGQTGGAILEQTASALRKAHWQLQVASGIEVPPSNDFLSTITFSTPLSCWVLFRAVFAPEKHQVLTSISEWREELKTLPPWR